jgi:hypothetical protein
MTLVVSLKHLARWFVWQIWAADPPLVPSTARITVFSTASQSRRG